MNQESGEDEVLLQTSSEEQAVTCVCSLVPTARDPETALSCHQELGLHVRLYSTDQGTKCLRGRRENVNN